MEQLFTFVDSLKEFWIQFRNYMPRVIASLLLLFVGWIVARLIEKAAAKFFRLIKLEEAAEKSGIENFLLRGGVQLTTSTLLAKLIYWFIMFTVTLAILNSIGLQTAAELFNKMILYIPNVIVAFIVLLFGSLFAKFTQSAAYAYLSNIGMAGAESMSIILKYIILFFVVSMALEQLNIGGQILVSAFQIAFGALCFALALAFGLGGKDWAGKILERFSNKKID